MSSYVIKHNECNCRKHTGHFEGNINELITWFAKFYVNQNFKTIGAEKNLGY